MDICLMEVFKQVSFKFDSYSMKYSSIIEIYPIFAKSELAVNLAMFEKSKLIGLA